jgi:hypothetical protein
MPVSLWWGDREVRAAWGIDYFVSPTPKAGPQHRAREGVDAGRGRRAGARPRRDQLLDLQTAGFADLGFVPFYQAILDPGAIAGKRYGRLAGRLAAPLTRRDAARAKAGPLPATVEVRDAAATSVRDYDALWETARTGYDACVRRDAGYVRWRYRETPHKQYAIVESRRRGRADRLCRDTHEDYKGCDWAGSSTCSPRPGSRQPGCAAEHRDAALRACRRRARPGAVHEPRARREPQAPWVLCGRGTGPPLRARE